MFIFIIKSRNVNSAKLRKDLSHLGSYGTRGVGYDVEYLRYQIAREIGVTHDWPVVIVGIGNLGHALANYSGFRSRGFRVVALLDADPDRHERARRRHRRAPVRRPRGDRRGPGRRHRRHRHAGHRRAGRRGPDGRRRRHQHPELRTDRAVGAGRRRRAQGRPVDRAADPRLPRAAQGRSDRRRRPRRARRPAPRDGGDRMSVLVVGVSHRSAPVPLLERLALDANGVTKLISDVASSEHVTEATVISTCNRLEIYADVDRFHGSIEEVSRLLVDRAGEAPEALVPHLYVHYDDGAVSHLFNVAAGLDSMVVGEGQILGQTRDALRVGQELGTVGPALNVLFQQALRVGKRSRAETDIDRAAPSLVTAALERIPGQVTGRRVVVVGAGSMASLAAATVHRMGASDLAVVNRTPDRAHRLATEYDARPVSLVDLDVEIGRADVLISCTGATGVLISRRGGRGGPRAHLGPAGRHRPGPAPRRGPRRRRAPGVTVLGLAEAGRGG